MNTTTDMGAGLSLDQLQRNPFEDREQAYGSQDDDKKLHVRFFMNPVEQTAKSITEGRRVFADTEYIEIMIPGDKHTVVRRQVFDRDRKRFPQQYARFKQGLADQTIGTPLSELSYISAAKVKEYEFFNIRTVEQLVATADSSKAGQAMMGFAQDKQKAQAFLEAAKGAAPVNELRAKIDERDAVIDAMQRQLSEMNAKLEKQAKPVASKG
jgi:DNA repair exonuclease SbcCD ATPase subunit